MRVAGCGAGGAAVPRLRVVQADLPDPVAVRKAMQGCDAAYYLVHEMGSGGDYREREAAAARIFADAAADAGLRRIIYLGGVAPGTGPASEHLRSRERVGEILPPERCPCWSYEPA
ncbi:MAG TPA: NAD(P)H-binding protein [Thermoanaerobaculia bacterium]|nr:NAD(P)H-binding protein [Thermoanaerobaculia bacterium]